jgi:hypothetical protein
MVWIKTAKQNVLMMRRLLEVNALWVFGSVGNYVAALPRIVPG